MAKALKHSVLLANCSGNHVMSSSHDLRTWWTYFLYFYKITAQNSW